MSNNKRFNKIAWLNDKKDLKTISSLKLQKFLFFYEMFQLKDGKEYDITDLKAYVNGPVFKDVYTLNRYNKTILNEAINEYNDYSSIDTINSNKALALISTLTDKDLSELSHKLDMWKNKEQAIKDGVKQIPIHREDITQKDIDLIKYIANTTIDNLNNYEVIEMSEKIFLFTKDDFNKLNEVHYEILELLTQEKELYNPVYISLDEKGALIVD